MVVSVVTTVNKLHTSYRWANVDISTNTESPTKQKTKRCKKQLYFMSKTKEISYFAHNNKISLFFPYITRVSTIIDHSSSV